MDIVEAVRKARVGLGSAKHHQKICGLDAPSVVIIPYDALKALVMASQAAVRGGVA